MYTLKNGQVHKNGVPLFREGRYLCGAPYKQEVKASEEQIAEANENLTKEYPLTIKKFTYNGFFGRAFDEIMPYKAKFIKWSGDPGVALCMCDDQKERLIPTFAITTSFVLPKDETPKEEKLLFGIASNS